jgi:hypothetical protein
MAVFSALFGGSDDVAKRTGSSASARATGNTPAAADPSPRGAFGRRRPPASGQQPGAPRPGPFGRDRSGSRPRQGREQTGTAVPRTDLIGAAIPEPPPALGADAAAAARAAALRVRKRGAGSSALTRLRPGGAPNPTAVLRKTALVGGGY